MFVEELQSPFEGGLDWSGRLLLRKVGASELLPEDKRSLADLVAQARARAPIYYIYIYIFLFPLVVFSFPPFFHES